MHNGECWGESDLAHERYQAIEEPPDDSMTFVLVTLKRGHAESMFAQEEQMILTVKQTNADRDRWMHPDWIDPRSPFRSNTYPAESMKV